eukprot:6173584-Pleurochrysis_carterae.AAC.6
MSRRSLRVSHHTEHVRHAALLRGSRELCSLRRSIRGSTAPTPRGSFAVAMAVWATAWTHPLPRSSSTESGEKGRARTWASSLRQSQICGGTRTHHRHLCGTDVPVLASPHSLFTTSP